MREFRRKLSVILTIAMVLALIPGAGAREITARAAEGLEEKAGPASVINLNGETEFYRKASDNAIYLRAEFNTATAANAYRDRVNSDPEGMIGVEFVDDPEGLSVDFWGDESAWHPYDWEAEEDDETALIIGYGVRVDETAPDKAIIRTTLTDQPDSYSYESKVTIKDIPVESKIKITGRTTVEVGKSTRIAVKVDDKDALRYLWGESSDEKSGEENRPNWKTDYWAESGTEDTVYFKIVGVNPGTSTYRFWIEGSENEVTTTVTVKERTMTLSDEEIKIDMNEADSGWLGIEDIGVEDIYHNGMADFEDSQYWDGRLEWYYTENERPKWSISDDKIAELEEEMDEWDDEEGHHEQPGFRWRIIPKEAGTATITIEWLGAKATVELTVTGSSASRDVHSIMDQYEIELDEKKNEGTWTEEAESQLLTEMVNKIAERLKTMKSPLDERTWDALNRLQNMISPYVEAGDWWLEENGSMVGMLEDAQYFQGNLPLADHTVNGEGDHFQVILDDAAGADVNAVSGLNPFGFRVSFARGQDTSQMTPIATLKVPVRLRMALPDSLTDVSEKDLVVYSVSGGVPAELPSGVAKKKGSYILLQIDQPGTYVLAKRLSKTPSSSGGSSYSSGSSSRTKTIYTAGWVQNETGWWYRNADGTWPANTWAQLAYNGRTDWYHFDANGYMQTGWFTDTDGRVYYLNPVSDGWMGSMFVGNHVIDGKSYYFNEASDGYKGALVQ